MTPSHSAPAIVSKNRLEYLEIHLSEANSIGNFIFDVTKTT